MALSYFGYKLEGIIGEGTYGHVYKACKGEELDVEPFIKFGPPIYAVKRQKAHPTKDQQQQQPGVPSPTTVPETSFSVTLIREVKLLRELHHPNIVKLVDCLLGDDNVTTLVFEYADFEMMRMIDFYKQHGQSIPEYTVKSFLYQTLKGVQYLHENWVVHRDLKPDNILIVGGKSDRRGSVVLADLGLARTFRNPLLPLGKVDRVVVTLWYRAPELLLGQLNYTPAIDMWSIGCIFASLLLAKDDKVRALFQGSNKEGTQNPFQSDQLEKIFRILGYPTDATWPEARTLPEYSKMVVKKAPPAGGELRKHFPHASDNCFYLLSRMLEMNPAKRITAQEALKSVYFSSLPTPGDNALENPAIKGGRPAGDLFTMFENTATTIKQLDFAQSQKQNEEIEARKRELRRGDVKRGRFGE
jgi:cyclin-dependent kinase 8/11